MLSPTIATWILIAFGLLFLFPLMIYVQFLMVTRPHNRKTKDLWLGRGQDWRDKTHLRFAYGAGWADLICWLPLLVAGSIGVILGQVWAMLCG